MYWYGMYDMKLMYVTTTTITSIALLLGYCTEYRLHFHLYYAHSWHVLVSLTDMMGQHVSFDEELLCA